MRHEPEQTRIRAGGTRVTRSQCGAEKIAAVREIVTQKQYAKIDGMMVDLFSASAIIAVYDALNEENKGKYASMPISKMATVAFKLLRRD